MLFVLNPFIRPLEASKRHSYTVGCLSELPDSGYTAVGRELFSLVSLTSHREAGAECCMCFPKYPFVRSLQNRRSDPKSAVPRSIVPPTHPGEIVTTF